MRARLAVLVVAVLFSTGGAAIKLASINAWQIAGLRSLIAFAVLFLLSRSVRQKPAPLALVLALPYSGVMVLFVHANTMASAGSVTLLQATAPLYVLLLSPWLAPERSSSRSWFVLPLFALGMMILLSEQTATTDIASAPTLGRSLAAGAGLCFGLIILGLSRAQASQKRQPKTGANSSTAIQAVAYGNLLASAIALPLAIATWSPLDATDIGVATYLGAIQIGLAYAILLPAMRFLSATEVSFLLLVELVSSPLFAAVVHGEALGLRTVTGGFVIILACIVNGLAQRSGGTSHPSPS